MLDRQIAQQRKPEHHSLESLDYQDQPDHDATQADHRRDQHHQERAEHRNDEEKQTGEFERDRQKDSSAPKQQALDSMEAYEPIPVIWIENEKDDRGDEREVGERSSDRLGKKTNLAFSARVRLHRAPATGAEACSLGHLRRAMRARGQGHVRLIHCPDHIKTSVGRQMLNQSKELTPSRADSMFRANSVSARSKFDARESACGTVSSCIEISRSFPEATNVLYPMRGE